MTGADTPDQGSTADELAGHGDGFGGRITKVEHAEGYRSGSMLVRPDDAHTERVWPLTEWIPDKQEHGGRVYRRTIVVVEDWREVPRRGSSSTDVSADSSGAPR